MPSPQLVPGDGTVKIFSDVYENMEAKVFTNIMAFDISAAFNAICHAKVLNRLNVNFSFSGVVLEWIASYLSDCEKCVKISRHSSTTSKLDLQLPQASVLGLLFFAACITPVGDVIKSTALKYHQYADDTQLYLAVRSAHYKDNLKIIEQCMLPVQDWFLVNDLLLNTTKLEVISQHRTTISVGMVAVAGAQLSFFDNIRSFGIQINCHFMHNSTQFVNRAIIAFEQADKDSGLCYHQLAP